MQASSQLQCLPGAPDTTSLPFACPAPACCPQDYSRAKAAAATPASTVIKAVEKGKETPQERLKRLMAAQLNKKIQKDSITAAQVGEGGDVVTRLAGDGCLAERYAVGVRCFGPGMAG
jgi:hypothetical protein